LQKRVAIEVGEYGGKSKERPKFIGQKKSSSQRKSQFIIETIFLVRLIEIEN
jgi:hypothetical protein